VVVPLRVDVDFDVDVNEDECALLLLLLVCIILIIIIIITVTSLLFCEHDEGRRKIFSSTLDRFSHTTTREDKKVSFFRLFLLSL
jgi:hypothetical protein